MTRMRGTAPKSAPTEVIDRLNRKIVAALANPGIRAGLAELGATGLPDSHAELSKLFVEVTTKLAKMVKFARIKAE